MASYTELDSFVKKFVSLWENGCDANLQVETTAGKASVSLEITLGPAKNLNFSDHGGCRGGSPSRQCDVQQQGYISLKLKRHLLKK